MSEEIQPVISVSISITSDRVLGIGGPVVDRVVSRGGRAPELEPDFTERPLAHRSEASIRGFHCG